MKNTGKTSHCETPEMFVTYWVMALMFGIVLIQLIDRSVKTGEWGWEVPTIFIAAITGMLCLAIYTYRNVRMIAANSNVSPFETPQMVKLYTLIGLASTVVLILKIAGFLKTGDWGWEIPSLFVATMAFILLAIFTFRNARKNAAVRPGDQVAAPNEGEGKMAEEKYELTWHLERAVQEQDLDSIGLANNMNEATLGQLHEIVEFAERLKEASLVEMYRREREANGVDARHLRLPPLGYTGYFPKT